MKNTTVEFVQTVLNNPETLTTADLIQLKNDRLKVEGIEDAIEQHEAMLMQLANKYLAMRETKQEIRI